MRNDGEKTAKKHRGILQMLRTLMAYSENQLAWVHPDFFLFQHHFFSILRSKFGQKCTNTKFIVGDHYWTRKMTSSQLFLGNLIMNQAAWTQFVGDNCFACVLCCRRWDTAQIKITLLSMCLGFSYLFGLRHLWLGSARKIDSPLGVAATPRGF